MRYLALLLPLMLAAEEGNAPLAKALGLQPPIQNEHELRISYTLMPRSFDSELRNKSTGFTTKGDGTVDAFGMFSIGYAGSTARAGQQIRASYGIALDITHLSDDEPGFSERSGSVGPGVFIGAQIPANETFRTEGFLGLGFGVPYDKTTFAGIGTIESDYGHYAYAQLGIRAIVLFRGGPEVFASAGWAIMYTYLHYAENTVIGTGELELRSHNKGAFLGLGAGWHF